MSQPNVLQDREWHLQTADLAKTGSFLPDCAVWRGKTVKIEKYVYF